MVACQSNAPNHSGTKFPFQEVLLLLLPNDRDVVLIIAGGGYEESNLKSLIKELKLQNKIVMTGNIPHSEVANYYSAADLFITGSITEVSPLTLLESLACGLPIIALSKSNLQDIVKNGENGFLTDESIKSFSERIDELLSNENTLKKLRKNLL